MRMRAYCFPRSLHGLLRRRFPHRLSAPRRLRAEAGILRQWGQAGPKEDSGLSFSSVLRVLDHTVAASQIPLVTVEPRKYGHCIFKSRPIVALRSLVDRGRVGCGTGATRSEMATRKMS